MNAFDEKDSRRVVPRWRDFAETVGTPELLPLDNRSPVRFDEAPAELQKKRVEWENSKGTAFASDFVGSAVTYGRDSDAIDAAKYLLSRQDETSSAVRNLAISLLKRAGRRQSETFSSARADTGEESRRRIRDLRSRIRSEPRNPIALVDIARGYTNLGLRKQAQEALERALALAPNSRFVIRSAARFFVHISEPERALALVRNHSLLEKDPWLLSAEIAISSVIERPSKVARHGRKVLDEKRFSSAQVTELASALGSKELEHGNTRKSKKLFNLSLESPTDNTVAQAEWASRTAHMSIIEPKHFKIARTFEARAFELFSEGKMENTYDQVLAWLVDEPFSTRPVGLGTYVASVGLEDYSAAITIARAGLAANPSDQGIRNSLIYALTMAGQLEEAVKEFSEVKFLKANDVARICLLATGGLLQYRRGYSSEGRHAYEKAIDAAKAANLTQIATIAQAYLAREEVLCGSLNAQSILVLAKHELEKLPDVTATRLIKHMLEKTAPR